MSARSALPTTWQSPSTTWPQRSRSLAFLRQRRSDLYARPGEQPRRRRACGASSATARWTSPKRRPRSGSRRASSLDNLIFVVNCNLQRLDGPVRGNGKVIQEFESTFRGMGWNAIKVDLGQRVGRAARARRRRRARQQDELDARRRLPEVRGRVGRVHPGALLRARPAAAQDGRAPHRRRAAEAAARRARLPQALRGVQDRGRARRRAHGHPRQDGEGLDARRRLRRRATRRTRSRR